MSKLPSVLVVSASAGNGHVSAGRALEAAVRDAGADALHVDVLELAPRWIRSAYGGGFELIASRAPRIWREIYQRSDGPDRDAARWGPVAHRVLFREFHRLLRSRNWSTCVCTHFLPAQLAAGAPGAPPFASVITDFTLHRYWVQPRVSTYFAPTPDVAAELKRRLPSSSVLATGIPVSAAFGGHVSKAEARRTLGLPPSGNVVLIMGGGMGLGIEMSVHAALRSDFRGIVVAVCGRNHGARSRLSAHAAAMQPAGADRLRVLGYTSEVPLLMSAADVVVTKPGGLTCSEALAIGTPLILTRAIPGHEEGNVRYLEQRGAAVYAPSAEHITSALTSLFGAAGALAAATFNAASAGVPGAARSIAAALQRRFTPRMAA